MLPGRVLNAEKYDDAGCYCGRVKEEQVESGAASGSEIHGFASALREMITNAVIEEVQKTLANISCIVKEAIEQVFWIKTFFAQKGTPVWFVMPWEPSFLIIFVCVGFDIWLPSTWKSTLSTTSSLQSWERGPSTTMRSPHQWHPIHHQNLWT